MTDRIADRDHVAGDGDGDHDEPHGEQQDEQHGRLVPDAAATPTPSRWARARDRRRDRVSRWDRPPAPRDWRYFVGTLGKVLIATGLLMFGFVAYQLWGTGIETARAQNRLEDAFQQATATIPDRPDPTGPADPADPDDTPTTTTAVDSSPDDEPLSELPVPSEVVPGGVDLSDVAVDQDIPAIDRGDVIARLQIPKIDKDLYVVAGVTLDDLKDGPGHYPDTPLPGQLGNAAIAGHRTTYGAPFFDVDQLVAGDELVVTTITGDRYVYAVTGVEVVSASDYWVVSTRDPGVAELTLTSCHPKYTARDRIVVHSVLVPERSSNVGIAESYTVGDEGDGAAIPGDDPTLATEPTAPGTTAGDDPGDSAPATPTTPVDESVPATNESPPDETAAPQDAEPAPGAEPEQFDAFGQTWFDDDGAWPQIALWGAALTLISLLAHQVAKRTRHDSIGIAVGAVPFLFCLYFFYQNVNRLLPPGL